MQIEGSKPLTNARHESFSSGRAAGRSLEDAWRDASASPFMSGAVARSNGHRAAKYPTVKARIAYLQAQATTHRSAETLEKKTPIQWMYEVCAVLRDTAEAFNHLPLQKRSKLKSVYALHLARLNKMEEGSAPEIHATDDLLWKKIHPCTCQT